MLTDLKNLKDGKKTNGHGGARPGSGLKKGQKVAKTLVKEAEKVKVFNFVSENLTPILEALRDNAIGLKIEGDDGSGGKKVYSRAPDSQSAKILLEHAFGKPEQAISGSGENGEIIVKTINYSSNAKN